MNILKQIFNSGKKLPDAIEMVREGADKLFFTQEERAELNKEVAEGLSQFVKDTASEGTDRSITRRYVAILIISVYLLLCIIIVVTYIFNENKAIGIANLVVKLDLDTAFLAVVGFFFSMYMLGKFVSDRKVKK